MHLVANSNYQLNLMYHHTKLPTQLQADARITTYPCDLAKPDTLDTICSQSDVIVHFAGVLFAPNPEKFLPTTNTAYAKNLINKAIEHKVKRFILVSFPHVEGPTSQDNPCTNKLNGDPISMHAKTRLAEEQYLFEKSREGKIEAISLRPGMIYGHNILMVAYARKLAKNNLLGVWSKPTPIHLIAIDDFLSCCVAAIQNPQASDIYSLGDDSPTTLQNFLDTACKMWKLKKPWRVPLWSVFTVAWICERLAQLFSQKTPFTVDFIKIGLVPYYCDTSRMKQDLLPILKYPTLQSGQTIL